MKKLFYLLLLITGFVNGQIVNIPDANFKARLITNGFDSNSDGEIQNSEALAIIYLDLSNQFGNYPFINDLTGIEYFTNLINFNCSYNQIAALNVSTLTNLQSINCATNTISNLDVSNLPNLLSLNCYANPIAILNLSNNLLLQSINCGSRLGSTSFLNTLALPFPTSDIREISVFQTNLTYMNLLNYPLLTAFAWHNNAVDTFDFSNSTQLTSLSLGGTFTSLDFSPLVNLKSINLALENNIPLDFTPLVALDHFSIGAISTSFTTLNLNNSPLLVFLSVQGTSISTIDIANCNLLDYIFLNQVAGVTSLDLSNFPNLQSVYFRNMTMSNLNLKNGGQLNDAAFQFTNIDYICSNTSDIQLLNDALSFINSNNYLSNVNSYCTFTPGGNYNTITGITTFDADNNGCDLSDILQPNIRVNINDGTTTGASFTYNTGNYIFYTQAGNFDITPDIENPAWFNFSPPTATIPFADNNNNTTTQDFCISANGVHQDLEMVMEPITPARPGFDAVYKLVYRNKGNTILPALTGGVFVMYDIAKVTYVSSSQPVTASGTNSINFSYPTLYPFASGSVEVTFHVNAPTDNPAVNIGDVLQFLSGISPNNNDENDADNSFHFNQTVVGSFDPNDVTCVEGNLVSPTEIGNYLHYVINFENTGTADAQNIVVRDVIDTTQFDVNSLQILNSSSPITAKLTGNIAEFIFQNINLHSGGHGNILIKIKSKNTLVQGNTVSKRANIYFDYNAPIDTNLENTTFQSLSNPNFETDASISVYPNPTNGNVNIKCNNNIKSVQLYDVQGRLLQTNLVNENQTLLDISNHSSGVYFLKIVSDKGIGVEKIVRE